MNLLRSTLPLGFRIFKTNHVLRAYPFSLCFKSCHNFTTSNFNKTPANQKSKQNLNNSAINPKQPSQSPPQPEQQEIKFTSEQEGLINSYKPDQVLNVFMNLDPNHNLQKDLIVAKKIYQKSTKQLRANILFEDLLKTQLSIPIYDTKGKPYSHMWLKNIFNILFFAITIWFFQSLSQKDIKNKIFFEKTTQGKYFKNIIYGLAVWFLFIGFHKYLKFQRRFVQKMVYDTKSEKFIMTKRGFFGETKSQEVSRFKLVYTENEFLNKKGTNYFNLETNEQYSIPYKESWLKQDLFSHLISQRIRI